MDMTKSHGGAAVSGPAESVPRTMRAAVLRQLNSPLVIEEVPVPELEHGEVLVRTMACGICGTDLHIKEGTGHKPKLPHILGHEPAGIVAKTGPGTKRLKVGVREAFGLVGEDAEETDVRYAQDAQREVVLKR